VSYLKNLSVADITQKCSKPITKKAGSRRTRNKRGVGNVRTKGDPHEINNEGGTPWVRHRGKGGEKEQKHQNLDTETVGEGRAKGTGKILARIRKKRTKERE